jgi:hypothetical protein
MGIETSDERIGDLYLLRKKSLFTSNLKSNIELRGYDYISEKLLTFEEMADSPESCQAKILNYAFNSPVIIKDYRQFFSLA